jgi:hypothetical protein
MYNLDTAAMLRLIQDHQSELRKSWRSSRRRRT